MKFSIIIPILNESKSIRKLTDLITKNLNKIEFEIIFVDDNSSDSTLKVLKSLKNKHVKYILRRKKKDLTKSCIEGIKISRYQNLVIMDGDLQHKPSCLRKMINMYLNKKPDILVGTRNFSNIRGLGFIRKNLSRAIILLINNILFKKKTNDPMSGFFIIKRNIFFKSENLLFKSGFKILFDIIYSFKIINSIDYDINFGIRRHNKSKLNFIILFKIVILIVFKFFQKKI